MTRAARTAGLRPPALARALLPWALALGTAGLADPGLPDTGLSDPAPADPALADPAPDRPAPASGAVDPALVGHYYLTGLRETGSELLLRADGTFAWMLAYGALDQSAEGRWHRDGDAVVLAAAPPRAGPLFALREVEPWSAAAEDELLRRAHDAATERALARCPFLAAGTATVAAPALLPDPAAPPLPAPDTLRAAADAALQQALALRARAEDLARRAVVPAPDPTTDPAAPAADPPPAVTAAAQALGAWDEARREALAAADRAGLPAPLLAPVRLPAACMVAERQTAAAIPPARWQGGIGLRVFDPASGQGAREVRAVLRFADGTSATAVTARRGLALLAGARPSPLVGVTLSAPYAPGRDEALALPPTASGVVDITIDAARLAPRPFDVLRLPIADGALLFAAGRGRYRRQP